MSDADQRYLVDGRDTFRLGGHALDSTVTYHGTQRLTRSRVGGGAIAYRAVVDYKRSDGSGSSRATGSFSSTVQPSGETRDGENHDPDFLTVLNQPFAVELDAPTLADLRGLRGAVPFDFPSPMTGAALHGTLRRLPDAQLLGERVLGVAFSANGPLHGALPDRPGLTIDGTIAMNGKAYYALRTALLVALDATLTIDGALDDAQRHDGVSIVYKRSLKPTPLSATARR